jgi:hypothetical protein
MGLRDTLAPRLGYLLLEYLDPWTVVATVFILLVFSLFDFEFLQRHLALRRILDFGRSFKISIKKT